MGADSMTFVREATMQKTFANATKVFEIPQLPIVVMTYGLGAFGRRSIESLIDEWSLSMPAYAKRPYTVNEVARDLGTWLFAKHSDWLKLLEESSTERQGAALIAEGGEGAGSIEVFDPQQFMTGIVVGGYEPDSQYPWVWTWEQPPRPGMPSGLTISRAHEGPEGSDGPPSGLDSWGNTTAIDRLVKGYDSGLLEALRASGCLDGTKEAELAVYQEQHRWQLVCEGMPVQDAVDLVRFMLRVGSGYERFRDGMQQIGGDVDIAVVKRNGVHWTDRKQLTSALAAMKGITIVQGPPKGEVKGM